MKCVTLDLCINQIRRKRVAYLWLLSFKYILFEHNICMYKYMTIYFYFVCANAIVWIQDKKANVNVAEKWSW